MMVKYKLNTSLWNHRQLGCQPFGFLLIGNIYKIYSEYIKDI